MPLFNLSRKESDSGKGRKKASKSAGPPSLTESAIRAVAKEDGWEDLEIERRTKSKTSSRTSKANTHKSSKSEPTSASKSHRRRSLENVRPALGGSVVTSSSYITARPEQAECSVRQRMPGQSEDPLTEAPGQSMRTRSLSPRPQDQFPGQIPPKYASNAYKSTGQSIAHPYYGHAAEYYHDRGESVGFQPGVRVERGPANPTHFLPPSAETIPTPDTGHGAAESYYFPPAAEMAAGGSTYYARPPGVTAASGAAIGAAAASAYHSSYDPSVLHVDHSYENDLGQAGTSSFSPTALSTRPRRRTPVERLLDIIQNKEDIRKMEEYTEYIGVCRYCFDPRSSPFDAPRPHHFRRRPSSESLKSHAGSLGRGRRRKHGVDKDSRYHSSSSSERGHSRTKRSSWLGAGFAGYGIAKLGNKLWRSSNDFDIGRDAKSGRSDRPPTYVSRMSEHSSQRTRRGVVRNSSRKRHDAEHLTRHNLKSSSHSPRKDGFYRHNNASFSSAESTNRHRSSKHKSHHASTKSRHRSQDDLHKTLLGIGATAAAISAVNSSRKPKVTTARGHTLSSHAARTHKSAEDDGWESASESEASVESALAFGDSHHTMHRRNSNESESSASDTNKWSWRWRSKSKKTRKSPLIVSPAAVSQQANPPYPLSDLPPVTPPADKPVQPVDFDRNSYYSMQHIEPKPMSSVAPQASATHKPHDRPRVRIADPEHKASEVSVPSDVLRNAAIAGGIATSAFTMTSALSYSTTSEEDTSGIPDGTSMFTPNPRYREDRRSLLDKFELENSPLIDSHGFVDPNIRSEHGTQTGYETIPMQPASIAIAAETSVDKEQALAERRRQLETLIAEKRQELAERRARDGSQARHHEHHVTEGVYDHSTGHVVHTYTPSRAFLERHDSYASIANETRDRAEQAHEQSTSIEAERIVADMEERYTSPQPSQAEFFSPQELARKTFTEETTHNNVKNNLADVDLLFTLNASQHRRVDHDSFGSSSTMVPYIGLITPTPDPGDMSPTTPTARSPVQTATRSSTGSPSIMASDTSRGGSRTRATKSANRVSWGPDDTRIFQLESPHRSPNLSKAEDFVEASHMPEEISARVTQEWSNIPSMSTSFSEVLRHTDSDSDDVEELIREDVRVTENPMFGYRAPFYETVSDLGITFDSPGTEGAPPVQGFVEGEVDEPTPVTEMAESIPGAFESSMASSWIQDDDKHLQSKSSDVEVHEDAQYHREAPISAKGKQSTDVAGIATAAVTFGGAAALTEGVRERHAGHEQRSEHERPSAAREMPEESNTNVHARRPERRDNDNKHSDQFFEVTEHAQSSRPPPRQAVSEEGRSSKHTERLRRVDSDPAVASRSSETEEERRARRRAARRSMDSDTASMVSRTMSARSSRAKSTREEPIKEKKGGILGLFRRSSEGKSSKRPLERHGSTASEGTRHHRRRDTGESDDHRAALRESKTTSRLERSNSFPDERPREDPRVSSSGTRPSHDSSKATATYNDKDVSFLAERVETEELQPLSASPIEHPAPAPESEEASVIDIKSSEGHGYNEAAIESLTPLVMHAHVQHTTVNDKLPEQIYMHKSEAPELIPLPSSPPPPYTETATLPPNQRSLSSTAVPIRFRKPPISTSSSPITSHQRSGSIDSTSTTSPETPVGRGKHSRPRSTEIRREFQPLYLVEHNRKSSEPIEEEILPPIPDSSGVSRESSLARGNAFEDALETFHEGSGQSTPKAIAFDSVKHKGKPEFWSWEDMLKEESQHQHQDVEQEPQAEEIIDIQDDAVAREQSRPTDATHALDSANRSSEDRLSPSVAEADDHSSQAVKGRELSESEDATSRLATTLSHEREAHSTTEVMDNAESDEAFEKRELRPEISDEDAGAVAAEPRADSVTIPATPLAETTADVDYADEKPGQEKGLVADGGVLGVTERHEAQPEVDLVKLYEQNAEDVLTVDEESPSPRPLDDVFVDDRDASPTQSQTELPDATEVLDTPSLPALKSSSKKTKGKKSKQLKLGTAIVSADDDLNRPTAEQVSSWRERDTQDAMDSLLVDSPSPSSTWSKKKGSKAKGRSLDLGPGIDAATGVVSIAEVARLASERQAENDLLESQDALARAEKAIADFERDDDYVQASGSVDEIQSMTGNMPVESRDIGETATNAIEAAPEDEWSMPVSRKAKKGKKGKKAKFDDWSEPATHADPAVVEESSGGPAIAFHDAIEVDANERAETPLGPQAWMEHVELGSANPDDDTGALDKVRSEEAPSQPPSRQLSKAEQRKAKKKGKKLHLWADEPDSSSLADDGDKMNLASTRDRSSSVAEEVSATLWSANDLALDESSRLQGTEGSWSLGEVVTAEPLAEDLFQHEPSNDDMPSTREPLEVVSSESTAAQAPLWTEDDVVRDESARPRGEGEAVEEGFTKQDSTEKDPTDDETFEPKLVEQDTSEQVQDDEPAVASIDKSPASDELHSAEYIDPRTQYDLGLEPPATAVDPEDEFPTFTIKQSKKDKRKAKKAALLASEPAESVNVPTPVNPLPASSTGPADVEEATTSPPSASDEAGVQETKPRLSPEHDEIAIDKQFHSDHNDIAAPVSEERAVPEDHAEASVHAVNQDAEVDADEGFAWIAPKMSKKDKRKAKKAGVFHAEPSPGHVDNQVKPATAIPEQDIPTAEAALDVQPDFIAEHQTEIEPSEATSPTLMESIAATTPVDAVPDEEFAWTAPKKSKKDKRKAKKGGILSLATTGTVAAEVTRHAAHDEKARSPSRTSAASPVAGKSISHGDEPYADQPVADQEPVRRDETTSEASPSRALEEVPSLGMTSAHNEAAEKNDSQDADAVPEEPVEDFTLVSKKQSKKEKRKAKKLATLDEAAATEEPQMTEHLDQVGDVRLQPMVLHEDKGDVMIEDRSSTPLQAESQPAAQAYDPHDISHTTHHQQEYAIHDEARATQSPLEAVPEDEFVWTMTKKSKKDKRKAKRLIDTQASDTCEDLEGFSSPGLVVSSAPLQGTDAGEQLPTRHQAVEAGRQEAELPVEVADADPEAEFAWFAPKLSKKDKKKAKRLAALQQATLEDDDEASVQAETRGDDLVLGRPGAETTEVEAEQPLSAPSYSEQIAPPDDAREYIGSVDSESEAVKPEADQPGHVTLGDYSIDPLLETSTETPDEYWARISGKKAGKKAKSLSSVAPATETPASAIEGEDHPSGVKSVPITTAASPVLRPTEAAQPVEAASPAFTVKLSKKDKKKAKKAARDAEFASAFDDLTAGAQTEQPAASLHAFDIKTTALLPSTQPNAEVKTEGDEFQLDEPFAESAVDAPASGAEVSTIDESMFERKLSKKEKRKARKAAVYTFEYDQPSPAEEAESPFNHVDATQAQAALVSPTSRARAEDDDLEFAATIAAGLDKSGFDPSTVLHDPAFHRRSSPASSTAEADPGRVQGESADREERGEAGRSRPSTPDRTVVHTRSPIRRKTDPYDDIDDIVAATLAGTGFPAADILRRSSQSPEQYELSSPSPPHRPTISSSADAEHGTTPSRLSSTSSAADKTKPPRGAEHDSWSFSNLDKRTGTSELGSPSSQSREAAADTDGSTNALHVAKTRSSTEAKETTTLPSPVRSTTKDRTSYLFQTPPSKLAAESFAQPADTSSHGGISRASSEKKRSKAPTDVGVPEHGIKATRLSLTPSAMFKQRLEYFERSASPDPVKSDELVGPSTRSNGQSRIHSLRSPTALSATSNASSHLLQSPPLCNTPTIAASIISNESTTPSLRRTDRSISGDLRAFASRGQAPTSADASTNNLPPFRPPPTPPLEDHETISERDNMSSGDVFEGHGDNEPIAMSPTRAQSIRRKQSSHILDLEARLAAITAENDRLSSLVDQSKTDENHERARQALNESHDQLRAKDAELAELRNMLEPLQEELARLTEMNASMNQQHDVALNEFNGRHATLQEENQYAHEQWQQSVRELDKLRTEHSHLSDGMEGIVRQHIDAELEAKDSEIAQLRSDLDVAMARIKELQAQIMANVEDDFLVARDEDYFDTACQKLSQHAQAWILRFSKASDNRACRLTSDLKDDKLEARLDNCMLDGSDPDHLLVDRVRRRDVFASLFMALVQEFVFTRYLFGMDRDQRQKLKLLEKSLQEIGPPRAVAHWRATTLTLLSRRPAFDAQLALDHEAVTFEIYNTLAALLPPPRADEAKLQASLKRVLRLAIDLSIEMRCQKADYFMLPPPMPEYDSNGELVAQTRFDAKTMSERSGEFDPVGLQAEKVHVKVVLFPLVMKKGDDIGEGGEETVIFPAQVLVVNSRRRPGLKSDGGRSRVSLVSVPEGSVYQA